MNPTTKPPPAKPSPTPTTPTIEAVRLLHAVTFPGGAVLGSLMSGATPNGGFAFELGAYGITATKDSARVLIPWPNVTSVVLK